MYRPADYYNAIEKIGSKDIDNLSQYSGQTEKYWPLDDAETESRSQIRKQTLRSKTRKVAGFNILFHAIRCQKPKYYFCCKVANCNCSFQTLKVWNLHHRVTHKKPLECMECHKKFPTPSAHRAHKNMHAPLRFNCDHCGKLFPFKSSLHVHRIVHIQQKNYKCFVGACKKSYKWPQDLHRHITKHFKKEYYCDQCDYSSTEKCLLKCHTLVHDDNATAYKYHCLQCACKSKHYSPYHKHIWGCKGV